MSKSEPRVLVPVDVSSEERPDPDLLELLYPAKVVLVGWHPVPDQTALELMRDEHEADAIERIEAIATEFPEGTDIETVVVFTRDRSETVDRVADEYECDVILVPQDGREIRRVLVPIRGDVNVTRIVSVVGGLLKESGATVTLYHASPTGEEDPTVGEALLRGVADKLEASGVDPKRIDTTAVESDSPVADIVDAAKNHDVLILGETEPTLVQQILGDVPTQIIERAGRPVLVVRNVDA
ncbi:universal stress protein [Halodesulfurarchaeum sp.]|uniref:universal stress protein n=1 Tax=Halodesulfurarchaeum sp. TaxID=1980530 RepID=UPI001BBEFBDF|nr:universal stress protein [Halodesulfurarchaeum sp.]